MNYSTEKFKKSFLHSVLTLIIVLLGVLNYNVVAQIEPAADYDLPGYPAINPYYPLEKNTDDYSDGFDHLTNSNAIIDIGKHYYDSSAYIFSGINSFLSSNSASSWANNDTAVSFCMNVWIKQNAVAANDTSVFMRESSNSFNMWFGIRAGKLTFSLETYSQSIDMEVSADSITPDTWHMLTANVKYSGVGGMYTIDNVNFYIDGVENISSYDYDSYSSLISNTGHFYGALNEIGDWGFNGLIDDIKIFRDTLSQVQVTDMYNYESVFQRHVRLTVDMNYQIGLGKFDTVNDYVDVLGDFDGWTGTVMDYIGNGYYSYTINNQVIDDPLDFIFRITTDSTEYQEDIEGGSRNWVVEDRINSLSYVFNNESYDNNLTMVRVDNPTPVASGSNESVQVTIQNTGYNSTETFNLSYSFDGGATITDTLNTQVIFGDEYTHTFSGSIDVSSLGIHTLKVFLSSFDENPYDDTIHYTINNLDTITVLPYLQDFELADNGWYS